MNEEKLFELDKISKQYVTKKETINALQNVSLSLPKSGFVFLRGNSGSGKTTLMNVMTGVDCLTSGNIVFRGETISSYSETKWAALRRNDIGIVFQNYNLLEDKTVFENLCLSLELLDIPYEEYGRIISNALKMVDLEGFEDRRCIDLSGGQKQRIAIARAIVKNPCVLWADEATGNLDPSTTEYIMKVLNRISKSCLVILISHSDYFSEKYADQIITLSEGKVSENADNRLLKKYYESKYEITIEGFLDSQTSDEFNLHKLLRDIDAKEHCFADERLLKLKLKKEKPEEKPKIIPERRFQSKKYSFECKWKLIQGNISCRKGQTLLSHILLTVCFSALLTFHLYTNNNFLEGAHSYINDEYSMFVPLVKHDMETNTDIQRGIIFEKELEKCFPEESIIKYKNDSYVESKTNSVDDCRILYNNNATNPGLVVKEGEWMSDNHQTIISSKLSKELSAKCGDDLFIDDKKYVVSGIYSDVDSACFVSLDFSANDSSISQVSYLKGINVLCAASIDSYGSSAVRTGALSSVNDNSLKMIYGKIPEHKNEVMVSLELMKENLEPTANEYPMYIRLPEYKDYAYDYPESLNLSEITGRNVLITGVYDASDEDLAADLIVPDSVYESLICQYNLFYLNHGLCTTIRQLSLEQLTKSESAGIRIDDYTCKNLFYSTKDTLAKLNTLTQSVKIAMVLLTILVCIEFLGIRIKNHKRRIGILKSLGFSFNEISQCYYLENLILMCVTVIFSCFLSFGLIQAYNIMIRLLNGKNNLEVLILNRSVLVNDAILFWVIGSVITLLPLFAYSRRSTIQLINGGTIEN